MLVRKRIVSNLAIAAERGAQNVASRILEAAIEEFDELPYVNASLSNIAERAETSKSLVSYHFPTKSALAAAVVNLAYPGGIYMGDFLRLSSPVEAIVHSAEHVADSVAHSHLARVALKLHGQPELQAEGVPGRFTGWIGRFGSYLDEAHKQGLIDGEIDIPTQSRLLAGGMIGLVSIAAGTGNYAFLRCDVSTITIDRLCSLGADVSGFAAELDCTTGAEVLERMSTLPTAR